MFEYALLKQQENRVIRDCDGLRLIFFWNDHNFSYPVSGNCIIYKKISYISLLVFLKAFITTITKITVYDKVRLHIRRR